MTSGTKLNMQESVANFEGLSRGTEAESGIRMWERSEVKGFQYVTFLSDGDSSAYKVVRNMNNSKGPYTTKKIMKEKCINHVKKRT